VNQTEGSTVPSSGFRKKQQLVHAALFGALAVVPVLALNSFATADATGPTGVRPGVADAQRATWGPSIGGRMYAPQHFWPDELPAARDVEGLV
jgi:hypothetical protein